MNFDEKPYLGLRISQNVYSCYYPFILDCYNRCSYNCMYCFANSRKEHDNPTGLRALDVAWFKDTFLGYKKRSGRYADCQKLFKERRPIKIGNLHDPLPLWERNARVTLRVLRLMALEQYPYILTTKGSWIADHPDYVDALRRNAENVVAQVSFAGLKPEHKFENNTSFESRLKLCETLTKNGIETNARLCVIPSLYTSDELECVFEMFRELGVSGLILEIMHLKANDLDGIREMNQVCKFDILGLYELRGVHVRNKIYYNRLYGSRTFKMYKEIAHDHDLKVYAGSEPYAPFADEQNCCGASKLGEAHPCNMRSVLTPEGLCFNDTFCDVKTEGWFDVNNAERYHYYAGAERTVGDLINDAYREPKSIHSPSSLFMNVHPKFDAKNGLQYIKRE